MIETALHALREIGALLDQGKFPSVQDGGVVVPGGAAVTEIPGKESQNEFRARKRRSATGSRKRSTRGEGKAGRSRPSGPAAPLIGGNLREQYQAGIEALREAYPQFEVWYQDEGMWLRVESALLPGLEAGAAFLVYLPFNPSYPVLSWGFWVTSDRLKWIGPRHTNFPDGSICAFSPKDGTWQPSNGIVNLLDLYSVWAVRHLHLREFDRWPGYQFAPDPYERRMEFGDDEYCGCEKPKGIYLECCKENDYKQNRLDLMLEFMAKHPNCGERHPPKAIVDFVSTRGMPPSICRSTPER